MIWRTWDEERIIELEVVALYEIIIRRILEMSKPKLKNGGQKERKNTFQGQFYEL